MADKENFDYRQLSNVLQVALLVVLAAFFIAIFIYCFVFSDGRLSSDQEIWGQFGDYLGGVINPIVAFMALMALVVSIRIQAKEMSDANKAMRAQLEHFESEAIKADLVRAIEAVSSEIDMRLSHHVSLQGAGNRALKEYLAAHSRRVESGQGGLATFENNEAKEYHAALWNLRKRVSDFSAILDAYENTGVHRMSAYTNQYRVKFKEAFEQMFHIGLITTEEASALSAEKGSLIGNGASFREPAFFQGVVPEGQRWWGNAND
ncbi:MAG TPA: hypothetical protein VIM96_11215 [Pseudomonadales bacterium]